MAVTTVEEAIRYTLINTSGVNVITTRIYPNTLPQNPTYPLIVYSTVSKRTEVSLNGVVDKVYVRIQFDAWAETYGAAKSLAAAINSALNCKKFTVDTVIIGSIVIQPEMDAYDSDVACHQIIQDATIWATE